jgi:hypothetical protein
MVAEFDINSLIKLFKDMTPEQQANFFIESRKNQQEQLLSGNVLKIYERISKVRVVEGIVSSDQNRWDIYIDNKILRIPVDKLEKQTTFRAQYLREFRVPAPLMPGIEWLNLLSALSENKKELFINPEESEEVRIAREVFEKIRRLAVSEDSQAFTSGRLIYLLNGRYYLRSSTIENMINDALYRISMSKLSETMTELGMKKPGTTKAGPERQRCWEFIPELLLKAKDSKDVEDTQEWLQ